MILQSDHGKNYSTKHFNHFENPNEIIHSLKCKIFYEIYN